MAAISARIKKMETAGIIEGYYSVIDSSRLGYLSFRVYIRFSKTDPAKEREIINYLNSDSRVWWLGLIQGYWSAGIIMWVRDLYDFRNFWLEFITRFRKNISSHLVAPFVKLRQYTHAYLSDKNQTVRNAGIIGEGRRIELSENERKLLEYVSEHARDSALDIARNTGLTPAVVKYALVQLVRKGIIVRFRAKINASALDYSLYKIDFFLDDPTIMNDMMNFAQSIPNLIYIDETIGGADFEAEFQLHSEQDFADTLEKFKKRFSSKIRETDCIVYSKVLKFTCVPPHAIN